MNRSEHDEQCAVISWFRMQYPLLRRKLFAVPNGGVRHPAVAGKLKAEGVLPGVFDIFLMKSTDEYFGLWIEMKSEHGRVSDHQRMFQADAEEEGFRAVVCYGFEEAKREIEEYLK